uniref:Uncharacterized protein n=1 Tax=Peronospora matthiolae TaxID=2874970 RepID=A0AAV1T1F8_9STRA
MSSDLLSPEEQEVLSIYWTIVEEHRDRVRVARDAITARYQLEMRALEAVEENLLANLGPYTAYHAVLCAPVTTFQPNHVVATMNRRDDSAKKVRVAMKAAKRKAEIQALPSVEAARAFRAQFELGVIGGLEGEGASSLFRG